METDSKLCKPSGELTIFEAAEFKESLIKVLANDGLVCMDMDGKIMWKTKNEPKFDKGSMILADGLILATDGTNKSYLIEPDPVGFK